MIVKTEAVVFSLRPISDTTSVLCAYTRTHGCVHYKVYGGRRKGLKALFTPLQLLELDADHRDTRQLQTIVDQQLSYVPKTLQTDICRQTVALFIAEMAQNMLQHPLEDSEMFEVLRSTVIELDTCDDPENVHLRFLVRFAEALGFAMEEVPAFESRRDLLHALIRYYEDTIPDFRRPVSLPILEEIFR